MSDYRPIGLSTDYQRQIIPHIFEAVTNQELNISMVIAQYNDMVMQLAALRDDNLAQIGSNLLLSEIGEALGCTPDETILTSIAALREADIRTMEHCDDCGALLVVDADTPDSDTEHEMYCPVCRCDAQAARMTALEASVEQAREVITRCSTYIGSIDHGENTKSYMMCDAWLAAHPAPQAEQEKVK